MSRLPLLVLGAALACSAPRPLPAAPASAAASTASPSIAGAPASPPPASPATWSALGSFFALSVADAAATAAWYREMLGFETLREGTSPDPSIRFALLRRGDHLIEIIQRRDAAAPAAMPDRSYEQGIFKIGFWVENLDALAAELKRKRARLSHDIVFPPGADYRTFAVLDPDSNVVQFFGR